MLFRSCPLPLFFEFRLLEILICFLFLVKGGQDLLCEERLRRLEFDIRISDFILSVMER